MRYLQFCSNPQLQAGYLVHSSKTCAKVLMEDFGVKFNKVIEDAEEAALNGEKSLSAYVSKDPRPPVDRLSSAT